MQHWINKFRCAGRGLIVGAHGQSSFAAHLVVIGLVLVLATLLQCSIVQWCILLLCIAVVLGLEYANSAFERLAKGLCTTHNEHVGAALDIAAAAVLVASLISVIIGLLIFISQAIALLA